MLFHNGVFNNMKRIYLIILAIIFFSSCAKSINSQTSTDDKTNQTTCTTVNSETLQPSIPTPTEFLTESMRDNEIITVIKAAIVPTISKDYTYIAEIYMQRFSNVEVTFFERSYRRCISAYENNECDFALITSELYSDENEVIDFNQRVLCRLGLAIIINAGNSVNTLTDEQVNEIFNKDITEWTELGGENGEISIYSVNDFLMGYLIRAFNADYNEFDYDKISHTYMFQPKSVVDNYPTGITGISVGKLEGEPEVKVVVIDNIVPTYDNVKSGEYPYYVDFKFITKSDVSEEVKKFIEFCTTDPEAIEYLKSEGYVIP